MLQRKELNSKRTRIKKVCTLLKYGTLSNLDTAGRVLKGNVKLNHSEIVNQLVIFVVFCVV